MEQSSNNIQLAIVLFQPEIPGNTGSIGRTCVALNIPLILIRPYGFDISEKQVRRAGLDYWKHLKLFEYNCFEDFIQEHSVTHDQIYLFTRFASVNLFQVDINKTKINYLVFGSETKGLSQEILNQFPNKISLPTYSDKIRSLNLSNCATAATYECLRKLLFT